MDVRLPSCAITDSRIYFVISDKQLVFPQCKKMMEEGRIYATVVYLGAIIATLIVAFQVSSQQHQHTVKY